MRHSESVAALAKALAAAQAEYVAVPKSKTAKVKMKSGGEFSYNYADLADCLSMALPRLSKHGIAFSQPHVIFPDGKLRVVTFLLHESGEWMESDGIEISEEGDPQQFGAEATYFRRYDGCSLIGVAPDEDTDAQQAGNRTRKVTPASVMPNPPQPAPARAPANGTTNTSPEGAISHPENAPRPTTTQQSAQQVTQRVATSPAAAQPQAAQVKFIPPDGLTCVVKGIKEVEAKPAEDGKRATRAYMIVTFLGMHNGCNFAYCFDSKFWPLLKESVGLECHFQIKERDKDGTHFINLEDVLFVDGVEHVDGKPVTEGVAQ